MKLQLPIFVLLASFNLPYYWINNNIHVFKFLKLNDDSFSVKFRFGIWSNSPFLSIAIRFCVR